MKNWKYKIDKLDKLARGYLSPLAKYTGLLTGIYGVIEKDFNYMATGFMLYWAGESFQNTANEHLSNSKLSELEKRLTENNKK